MIKRFLQKTIVLVSQIVMLILAIFWYMQRREIEPLITIIALGTTLIISLFLKAKEETNINYSLPRFKPQDGYISKPLYIFSQQDITIESLIEIKKEIEALIENYKFQIIEHKSEIKKIKITLERFEKDIEMINEKIKNIG